MFKTHVVKHLSAYLHMELSVPEALRIERHLSECSRCRAAYDEISYGAHLASFVRRVPAPEALRSGNTVSGTPRLRGSALALLFVCIALMIGFNALLWNATSRRPGWDLVLLDSGGTETPGRLGVGDTLRTGSTSARVQIADIGRMTVDANTEIRLLESNAEEHRIALDKGRLDAFTWAPPRVFFVETPSGVAIDLGCAYTLEVEEDGSSLLHVTLGLVALELNGRESMVPRGAFCRMRPGSGPGTPYFDDSAMQLRVALDTIETGWIDETERERALGTILDQSRIRDTLTLWHLIPRLDQVSRGKVYDRMAELVPPPGGVTREGVMALDLVMLDLWREKLTETW